MKPLLGIALKLASAVVFTVMGMMVKLVAAQFPTGEIVFFRSFFALVPLLVWLAWEGEIIETIRTHHPVAHLRRSLCSTAGMYSGFFALAFLAVADATAIGYVTPLVTTLLAVIILKERVRGYRWGALAVGFCGMVVMLWPYFGGHPELAGGGQALGAAVALLGACFSAVASIEVRRLAQYERTGAIVFYFSVIAAVIGLLTSLHAWVTPTPGQLLLLIGAGILGGVGQILITASYRFAPISVLAPFDYTTLIWAMLLGYLVFGDIPVPLVLVGATLVIAAGLVVIWRESVLGIEVRRERESRLNRPM